VRDFLIHMMEHRHHRHGMQQHCHPEGRFGGRGRHQHGGGDRFGRGDRNDGMFRGRRFSSDDLQLLLLARLREGQSHGYELIKALADMSEGVYSPSPGMVYPALTYLEELGYADVTLNGNKKLYNLADAGQAFLEKSKERVDELLAMLVLMAKRARAMRETEQDDDLDRDSPLMEARLVLKEALRASDSSDSADRAKVADILKRAADEIRALRKSR
jgi:DNA-binding PadR family transcriptional regulator